MKILALSGSPRKRNTVSALAALQEHSPDIEFEVLTLKDLDLRFCKGCYACIRLGEERCPLKDDRDVLLQRIENADGLILASPTYSHMVPALMKNLFDRLGYLAHRPQFFDKHAMSIVTCSGYGAEHASNYMDKMLRVFGFNVAPSLELQYKPVSKAQKNGLASEAIAAFETFLDQIRKGEKAKPTLGMIVPFGIFKAVSFAARDDMPADYEYYKDKKDFFYDVKLPSFTKWIADRVVKKELGGIL